MAWNDPLETIVAGSGEVNIAAVGTALPAKTTEALNAKFEGLGYHTEDGVSVNQAITVAGFKAWQSPTEIRRVQDSQDFEISFALLQWNEVNLPFAFGGGTISEVSSGQFKYVPPAASAALDERALIVDVDDGSRRARFIVPRGTVTETSAATFKRTEMATLAVTFKALTPADGSEPWRVLFDDAAAFAVGS